MSDKPEYLQRIEAEYEARAGILSLGGLGLTEIPQEVFEMDWLRELSLGPYERSEDGKWELTSKFYNYRNRLRTIPEELLSLKQLTYLNLSYCGIKKIENLPSTLTHVHLRSNQIEKIEGLPASLEHVSLSYNQIVKIEGLPASLEHVSLSYNQIVKIEGLPSFLEHVDFIGNRIEKIEGLPSSLEHVDLSENQIVKVEGLPATLERVYLNSNQILKIEGLPSSLEHVDLSYNQIVKIEGLPSSLERVDLRSNQILKIEGLPATLERVYLSENKIGKIEGLPESLRDLDLSGNQIRKIEGLPVSLEYVDLSYNQIVKIEGLHSSLQVISLEENEIKKIENLPSGVQKIEIYSNPIYGYPHALLGDYLLHFDFLTHYHKWNAALEQGDTHNRQSKILVLGNGNVGKSSVVEALKHETSQKGKDSTHGIILDHWQPEGSEDTYHIWDFGGQEIYHGTHQLFYAGQSIVLIVYDPETEDKPYSAMRTAVGEQTKNQPIPYWIETVRRYSHNAQVILVQNKNDEHLQIMPQVRHIADEYNYPIISMSATSESCDGYEDLRYHIRKATKKLYEYDMRIPTAWSAVRDHYLQIRRKAHNKLLFQEKTAFAQVAIDYGVDEGATEALLTFLSNSGIVYYDADSMQDHILVDLRWALEGIYTYLRRDSPFYKSMREDYKGICRTSYAMDSLQDYKAGEQKMLLSFMRAAGICIALYNPDEKDRELMFPEFLPDKPSSTIADALDRYQDNMIILRYQDRYLSHTVIQRVISEYATKTEKCYIWRQGILVRKPDSFYLVADPDAHTLQVHIARPSAQRWLPELSDIMRTTGLKSDLWMQKVGEDYESYDIQRHRSSDKVALPDVAQPATMRIAISYAREDGVVGTYGPYSPLEELVDSLSVYVRNGDIRVWYDRDINKNDWDGQIKKEFRQADVILVLSSLHYNKDSKKYIWEHEIPIIQEKLAEDKLSVVRINISNCTRDQIVESVNDFKILEMPANDAQARQGWLKKIVDEIIIGKMLPSFRARRGG